MQDARFSDVDDLQVPLAGQIAMSDTGLTCGTDVLLAGMAAEGGTANRLALERDRDRLLALVSVAAGEPVPAANVLPHVEAASQHWQHGDKALANLRLVFARLPSARDADALANLRTAGDLLDGGMTPAALMKALWPYAALGDFAKYSPDQRRVPAGHGIESGRWEAEGQGGGVIRHPDGRIVVAVNLTGKKPSPAQETDFKLRDLTGDLTPEQRAEHNLPIVPLEEAPAGPVLSEAITAAIGAAIAATVKALGPGRGPVYGTKVHTEVKRRLDALKIPELETEQSFRRGEIARRSDRGSIRVDVIHGDARSNGTVFDLKTGSARLTAPRAREITSHLPKTFRGSIKEIKP